MITNEYIQGLINGLKMVAENTQFRMAQIEKLFEDGHISVQEANYRKFELEAIAAHLNQIRESYKQLVKQANEQTRKAIKDENS